MEKGYSTWFALYKDKKPSKNYNEIYGTGLILFAVISTY